MYEVIFTPESEVTFDSISEQLLERWGIGKVIEFQNLVEKGIHLIATDPFLNQVIVDNFQIRKYHIHPNVLFCTELIMKK
ncbi:hypothetical protein [Pedobacter jamesrossensis]|uniref:Uncharacterized protein n=1 Tax=Pedobacter jamesrossensis TaxID=1908238 RepID=A0ABV8NH09_9SPHI